MLRETPPKEDLMNTLLIYDSQYGNTERIATAIADTLRTVGDVRAVRVGEAQPLDLTGVDLLVLGSPTQGWNATKAMQELLKGFSPEQLRGRAVACFDTRFQMSHWLTGSAARRIASVFERMGIELAEPPESFFVEHTEGPLCTGELARAAVWARLLFDRIETPRHAIAH